MAILEFILGHPIILGVLAVLAAVAFGYGDMLRFRMRRVNAIAGVCFAESIRRRILWITPLAIVGVVVVSLLQKSLDEQDAIRQTSKYCLFAAGMIVTIAAILLASTNLPKEIESRVIFTVVTKPITRLEIILGKVLGFAAVSGVILLIMGIFTWVYLQARSAAMLAHVRTELESTDLSPGARSTYSYYSRAGLLSVKSLEWPHAMELSSRVPDDSGYLWMAPRAQQYFAAPFVITQKEQDALAATFAPSSLPPGQASIHVRLRVQKHAETPDENYALREEDFPVEGGKVFGPSLASTNPSEKPSLIPQVVLQISTEDKGKEIDLGGKDINLQKRWPENAANLKYSDNLNIYVPLSAETLDSILKAGGKFKVELQGATPTMEYGVTAESLELVLERGGNVVASIKPADWENAGQPFQPKIDAHIGRNGTMIRGQPGGGAVGIFRFANAPVPADPTRKMALQVKVYLDRSGDLDTNNVSSELRVQVHNRTTGFKSEPIAIDPETGRASFVDVPHEAVAGGNFDVYVQGTTPGQNISLQGPTAGTPSVALATADHSFAFNLFKSLLMLWLLSVLVVTISVFCSTFLSWPIAVVLTLMLLLSRWGVDELGDTLSAGGQRSVVVDIFGVRDPYRNKTITDSLEVLTGILRNGAKILPDISQFPAFEDIERGVNIESPKLKYAAIETFGYGIPVLLLSYLILKRKEVAP